MMIYRETNRLHIRNFRNEDWVDLLEIAQKYENSEFAKYDHKWPQTADEMKQAVDWFSAGDSFVAIELKADEKVIGLISLPKNESITDENVYGFGYVFNLDYQGKGYAIESCMNILDYLFNEIKIDKIITGTAVVNKKSCELLERLGFKETSRKKHHFRKDSNNKPIEFLAAEYEVSADDWNDNLSSTHCAR
jgi:ribosomal-protein-alanine N-acetyltransferase